MNIVDFLQTGGFPLEANSLKFMQDAYTIFNKLGELSGDKTILSGCELEGGNITDGVIYVNGEVLTFKGGIPQTSIVIVEEVEDAEFEDGQVHPTYKTKYATFGTSGNSIPWSEFKRYYINQPIKKEIKWVGREVTNDDLPRGWFIADGQNGTDNVLGRMIVGKDGTVEFKDVGQKGGEKKHTLTIGEMPSHNHGGNTGNDGNHTHSVKDGSGGTKTNSVLGNGGNSPNFAGMDRSRAWVAGSNLIGTSGAHSHSISSQGGGAAHNNLPPYIVMIPIQFIG